VDAVTDTSFPSLSGPSKTKTSNGLPKQWGKVKKDNNNTTSKRKGDEQELTE
jgi:hypothetical protein